MLSDQDSGNPFGGQTPFVKIRSLKAQSKALVPRINDTTHDALASIVQAKLLRVLAHHDQVEK